MKPFSQRSKIASMISSKRRKEAALAKIRREEVERQVEAKLRLKTQEIQLQSMKGQLELDVVVEESRQKLAEATIEEAGYQEHASEISGLQVEIGNRRSGEPNGGRQDKKLGEHSIPTSRNSAARGAGPKCQHETCFWVLVFFNYWTAFQQESDDDS